MRIKKEFSKDDNNATVYNRIKRLDLRCSICRPHKGSNCKHNRKYGTKKPKYKDKRK